MRQVRTDVLDVGLVDAGPPDGPVALLHGFPYDVHSYVDVVPRLVDAGMRVVVPYLRGHGPTRFLSDDTVRSGQQAALGADVVALLDALDVPEAVLAGCDWGGRAACVTAALWPERCTAIVAVNGYLVQDIAASTRPLPPALEAGFGYFFSFATERGRAGLTADRRGVAEVIWARNSPKWHYDDAVVARTAEAFANPDHVEVVLHSYRHRHRHRHRHRLGLAPGAPEHADLERRLAELPEIRVPTVTLDGLADGNFPATDGTAYALRAARLGITERVR